MQKMLVILLLVFSLYANDTIDLTSKEKAWININPVVSYSGIEQKPLSVIKNKKMNGIMGAYIDLISELTGLSFVYIPSKTWTEVLEKFKNKEIDMIPGIISNTSEVNLGLVSETYVEYSMVIVTNKDYQFLQSIEDIKQKRFAIVKDERSYNFVRMNYPGVSITPTEDIETALELVKKGRADAFVGHIASTLYYIDELKLSSLKVSGTTKFIFQHHFLLNKDNTILTSILNKAITAISNQQKANINAHWLKTKADNDINIWLVGLIICILLAVFIFFYIRQRNLQKINGNLEVLTHRMNLSLKSIKGGIWDLNLEDNSVYFDSNIKEMLGYAEYEFPNEFDEWKNRIHPDDFRTTMRDFHEAIDNKYTVFDSVHRLKHKDGYWIWASILAKLVFDEDGSPVRMMGLMSDVTVSKNSENEIKRQKDVLFYQAHHDSLTSLPNRALFLDRLELSIARAERDNGKVALLFIDLDEFKQINDSLGHTVGDKLLVAVTKRLNSLVRNVDTLSRIGGDEFTIIVDDVKNAQNAALVCQKVLNVLAKPILIDKQTLYISASIGISMYPNDAHTSTSLLKFADAAMYKAKHNGRNNYKYYSSEMTELAFEHVAMEASLRKAIEADEFIVFYQVQIDAVKNEIQGFEALIRWEHPSQGLVSPEHFISLAEENELIIEMDKIVMRSAMTQMVAWHENGLNPGVLSLNLSMKNLNSIDFLPFLTNLMAELSFQPEWLELELLEGHVMIDPNHSTEILKHISALGIEISIDDFGTGYSSLSYLKKLPINKLKIDKSFVDGLPSNEEDIGIVKTIIALSKSLNLKVIAEGVEKEEQKDFLVKEGCAAIQGYIYSKPLSAKDTTTYIKEFQE